MVLDNAEIFSQMIPDAFDQKRIKTNFAAHSPSLEVRPFFIKQTLIFIS